MHQNARPLKQLMMMPKSRKMLLGHTKVARLLTDVIGPIFCIFYTRSIAFLQFSPILTLCLICFCELILDIWPDKRHGASQILSAWQQGWGQPESRIESERCTSSTKWQAQVIDEIVLTFTIAHLVNFSHISWVHWVICWNNRQSTEADW